MTDEKQIKKGEYFVSIENTFGQVTWTAFSSKDSFEEFRQSMMKDGSGRRVSECYPIVHYEGYDQAECMRVSLEQAIRSYANPLTPLIHTLAECGTSGKNLAKTIHEATKVD
jgi:hypothetical protein